MESPPGVNLLFWSFSVFEVGGLPPSLSIRLNSGMKSCEAEETCDKPPLISATFYPPPLMQDSCGGKRNKTLPEGQRTQALLL